MANYRVELTSTRALINGQVKAITKSVLVENTSRSLAIALGMDQLFQWAEKNTSEEATPVPAEAITYWKETRANGNVQMMDVQMKLEQWGISFIIKDAKEAEPEPPVHRDGKAKAVAPVDFRDMLAQQYKILQEREKQLRADRKEIDEELKTVNRDLMDIGQFLATVSPREPKKKLKVVSAESRKTAE